MAAAAPHSGASRAGAAGSPDAGGSGDAPFGLSVMLWTVFRDLSLSSGWQKVAEAGYRNVELVGEYAKWSDDDFARANAARKRLGIHFDATAGLRNGIGNPAFAMHS